jgi:PPOX class probable F420-dependent enzyme
VSWDPDRTSAFLADGGRIGRLATVSATGEPHVTPVWFRFDEGRFLVHTFADSRKAHNIAATGRFALTVDTDHWPYEAVLARGTARHAAPHEIDHRRLVEATAAAYLGTHPGAEYGRWMADLPGEHAVLVLEPQSLTGWDYH